MDERVHVVTLRMPVDLWLKLVDLAEKNRRTFPQELWLQLEEHLKEKEVPPNIPSTTNSS